MTRSAKGAGPESDAERWVRRLDTLGVDDLPRVGGKNASLGEMTQRLGDAGVRVPPGFATTADAYRRFIADNDLAGEIASRLEAWRDGSRPLAAVGGEIRALIEAGEWPAEVADAVRGAYAAVGAEAGEPLAVAVRSSATAEDLPEASFAGQLESFLHISGDDALLEACQHCYASLFTDRAIAYRHEHGFDDLDVALSVGVQTMVRSDLACAGVLFTLDPETGFPHTTLIQGAWGLGESVVQGIVSPDEFSVFTPFVERHFDGEPELVPILARRRGAKEVKMIYDAAGGTRCVDTDAEERAALVLSDDEVLKLARWGEAIAAHSERPMDIEWAKDGESGELFIVQARPETVQSRREAAFLETYSLDEQGDELVHGAAVGDAIAVGPVCRLGGADEIGRFRDGSILVTPVTDPDWVPIMRRAAGIVTDHGGRTSHAAIVSRELGIPAVVGAGDATERLRDGQVVTLSCAEGDVGRVFDGALAFSSQRLDLEAAETTRTRVMINVASPAAAMRWWRLPCRGIGLLRMEYIVSHLIRIHPMALARFESLEDGELVARIGELTAGYDDPREFFVDRLAQGLATIAASRHPEQVIVRMSDFKSNEYASLIGGAGFEPDEENPMIGWRGASRYDADGYREGFALECAAVRRVRRRLGFTNLRVMIPFCRTPAEADTVLAAMAEHGLVRGEDGLEVWVMCEVPSNVILAEAFAERFDGFSIGSNDLTQLTLGVDRDSERLAHLFDENDAAVRWMIEEVIRRAHAAGRPVGLCGQRPSDDPEFAAFLVGAGIDSISVTPDSFLSTLRAVAAAEAAAAESADDDQALGRS
ncbi:MAG: phosphoenolpyruvate synthase [Acidobacteriota bacterium]